MRKYMNRLAGGEVWRPVVTFGDSCSPPFSVLIFSQNRGGGGVLFPSVTVGCRILTFCRDGLYWQCCSVRLTFFDRQTGQTRKVNDLAQSYFFLG
jgi:hypothetical protein